MSYYLKNFDEILIEFQIGKPGLEERVTSIDYINEDKRNVFPAGMEISLNGLTKWIQHRSIPKNRTYVHEILAAYGLKQGDYMKILFRMYWLWWLIPDIIQQSENYPHLRNLLPQECCRKHGED